MKRNAKSLAEGMSESTVACLVAMVQGNVLSLTVGHLLIATQTGVVAGAIAFVLSLLVRVNRIWVTPVLLAICTSVVDYNIHPGSFGSVASEAIVTGLVAGLLSLLVAVIIKRKKQAGSDYE